MIEIKDILKHLKRSKNYSKYGDLIENPNGILYYQDNGSDILAVAHLDYVMWSKPEIKGYQIICPQLDDRLGVAAILEFLPEVGNFDILLSDEEETARSTAQFFQPSRQYRYIIQFDRAGSDFVAYQHEGGALEYTFELCGWESGLGSYSDIAFMDIGCEGVNLGIGYHNAHTKHCYCNLAEVNSQLARFAIWYSYYGQMSFTYKGTRKGYHGGIL